MWRAAWVSRPPSQIGCILSLAASKSRTSRASSLRRSVRSCTVFPLCAAPPAAALAPILPWTVSAIQPLIISAASVKINEARRSMCRRLDDHLIHPGRRHDMDGNPIGARDQQEVSPFGGFQVVNLTLREVERLLQFHRL